MTIRPHRLAKFAVGAVCLAIMLVVVSAVLVTNRPGSEQTPTGRGALQVQGLAQTGDMASTIASLQQRLQRLPQDAESWAALGAAYVQQARVTGDPRLYPKAAGVLRRSLVVSPTQNAPALTGLAALAAARHDFVRARRLSAQALKINPYSSAAMAIHADALVELGRYDDATVALRRYVNVKPGVPAYARVSYNYELHGNLEGARYAMRQAAAASYSPDDRAFALFELGELAWNSGRLQQAQSWYRQGWRISDDYVPNLYGLAKTDAALGDNARAVDRFQRVVNRLPQPSYLIEYADLLTSLGRQRAAANLRDLLDAQQRLLRAAGVNLDLELSLYDADHGRPARALAEARQAWQVRKSVFVEDAYAWALHVNGRDRAALRHLNHAQRLGTRSALFEFHRGMIERALGHKAAAQAALRKALAINPAFNPLLAQQARKLVDR